jgi:hypothetical protein
MTHVLDTYPLDFSKQEVRDLRSLLAQTFDSGDSVKVLLRDSGIDPTYVNTARDLRLVWTDALDVARKQDRLRVLLSVAASEPTGTAIRPTLDGLLAATTAASTQPQDAIDWKIPAAVTLGLERVIESESTLLDISFLERGVELSASVAKLVVTLNDLKRYYGTAFRIGADLLLTNHHVLFDSVGAASTVEAWFGYETAFGGAEREHTVMPCRADSIVGRADHDWAVVRTAAEMPAAAQIIPLNGARRPAPLDRVYIIQHPRGEAKKIGMIHNIVTDVTDDVLQYRTDTDAGSSGSPVFNEKWQVVGLHHRWETTVRGGRQEYVNQGRLIGRVIDGLKAEGVLDQEDGG